MDGCDAVGNMHTPLVQMFILSHIQLLYNRRPANVCRVLCVVRSPIIQRRSWAEFLVDPDITTSVQMFVFFSGLTAEDSCLPDAVRPRMNRALQAHDCAVISCEKRKEYRSISPRKCPYTVHLCVCVRWQARSLSLPPSLSHLPCFSLRYIAACLCVGSFLRYIVLVFPLSTR